MFTTADLLMNTMTGSDTHMGEERQAVSLFEEIRWAASRSSLVAFLTGRGPGQSERQLLRSRRSPPHFGGSCPRPGIH